MKNTWVELNLGVLRDNVRCLKNALGDRTEIIFVVKSDAYGHGMLPVARCAWEIGVKWFAVAYIDEAIKLRENLSDAKIIIMGVIEPDDVTTAIEKELIPSIVSERHALALGAVAAAEKHVLSCDAKIDTGMGRLGIAWEEADRVLLRLADQPGLDISGISSHFASAYSGDRSFADLQAERFSKVIVACEEKGLSIPFKHISNSGGILCNAAWDMDAVRPGILLYGYGRNTDPATAGQDHAFDVASSDLVAPKVRSSRFAGTRSAFAKATAGKNVECGGEKQVIRREIDTKPFLQWKTRVIQVKRVPARFPVSYDSTYVTDSETHIATIDAGYADGYSRLLSNKGFVIVGGQRRPVVGRVTMNLITVDLGPATNVKEWDEVTLLGAEGGESLWANEIAEWCGTISYEVLTDIRTDDRRIK